MAYDGWFSQPALAFYYALPMDRHRFLADAPAGGRSDRQ